MRSLQDRLSLWVIEFTKNSRTLKSVPNSYINSMLTEVSAELLRVKMTGSVAEQIILYNLLLFAW